MKSQSVIYLVVAIVIVLAIGGVAYGMYGSSDGDAMMKDEGAMMQKEETGSMMEKDGDAMMEKDGDAMTPVKGSFVPYDSSLVAKASPDNKTVLFFNASWCPKCQAAAASLRDAGVPEGVTVLSVDYDSNAALRQKHGVTYQHTFVQVDASGNQIAKWSGSSTGADIAAKAI